ncbi:MAG: hypothetical protein HETSPECPRED_000277 [Heterodermia speciosa]|uniref:Sld7 C-terminal domain-containing protein n=1 Tax=Heterodermia speciosa TaxID=116794 RepID=A0A8H3I8D4_9LECA|nr:MAG: hypothetical protein HETSPECPRED_000277 [Heterodermia speciosa]
MEIWAGDISIEGDPACIQDVHFDSSHASSQTLLPKISKLRALAVVSTSDVPFYLVAGPALGVSTNEAATEEFFSRILLGGDQEPPQDEQNSLPWWQRQLQQSEYSILLKVDHGAVDCKTAATEVLVYAAVDHSSNAWDGMITPPRSSSPGIGESAVTETDHSPNNLCLKLYALPLDSRRIESLSATRSVSLAGSAALGEGEARFLPFATTSSESQQASHKRRKLSNVFDEANYRRRKLKGRGGESISRAMAEAGLQQPGKSVDNTNQHEKPLFGQQPLNDQPVEIPHQNLSRTSSTSSLPNRDSSRPRSKKPTLTTTKKTSLNRLSSIISAPDTVTPSDSDNPISQQNKSTLARIVMAGMRLHGLQPQKKPSTSKPQPLFPPPPTSTSLPSTTDTPDPDPDEYKAIYHQTFKAASFTFRSHFGLLAVAQESMREVVDRLLSIFCIDPRPSSSVTVKPPRGAAAAAARDTFFGSQEETAPRDVFDQPSSTKTGEAFAIGTPSSRRKGAG